MTEVKRSLTRFVQCRPRERDNEICGVHSQPESHCSIHLGSQKENGGDLHLSNSSLGNYLHSCNRTCVCVEKVSMWETKWKHLINMCLLLQRYGCVNINQTYQRFGLISYYLFTDGSQQMSFL